MPCSDARVPWPGCAGGCAAGMVCPGCAGGAVGPGRCAPGAGASPAAGPYSGARRADLPLPASPGSPAAPGATVPPDASGAP
ncbi:hypothetical protein PV439_44735, partial [Streptomyces scabiei]|nr:hypothetical protein [Streptomyces scabiei]